MFQDNYCDCGTKIAMTKEYCSDYCKRVGEYEAESIRLEAAAEDEAWQKGDLEWFRLHRSPTAYMRILKEES